MVPPGKPGIFHAAATEMVGGEKQINSMGVICNPDGNPGTLSKGQGLAQEGLDPPSSA